MVLSEPIICGMSRSAEEHESGQDAAAPAVPKLELQIKMIVKAFSFLCGVARLLPPAKVIVLYIIFD